MGPYRILKEITQLNRTKPDQMGSNGTIRDSNMMDYMGPNGTMMDYMGPNGALCDNM